MDQPKLSMKISCYVKQLINHKLFPITIYKVIIIIWGMKIKGKTLLLCLISGDSDLRFIYNL